MQFKCIKQLRIQFSQIFEWLDLQIFRYTDKIYKHLTEIYVLLYIDQKMK